LETLNDLNVRENKAIKAQNEESSYKKEKEARSLRSPNFNSCEKIRFGENEE